MNAAAFSVPPAFALGNTGGPLDDVRGFAQKSEAISFSKQTPLGGTQRIVVGLDITNPFQLRAMERPEYQHFGRSPVRVGHVDATRTSQSS